MAPLTAPPDLFIALLLCALPAVIAGSAHMLVVRWGLWPWLARPLDGGRSWRGARIFGDNKTWRGLVCMILFSILGCYTLMGLLALAPGLAPYAVLDFSTHGAPFYGILYGLGYSLFELPNSFLKRRRNIRPGQAGALPHILLDQADSVFGCLLLLFPFSRMTITFVLTGVVAFTLLHLAVNYLLFLCKLRAAPL
ncbi:CDP-archaeol synthase [Niveispirillum sp.]|uniref:CDP-archaeol synthase n=1 Tax=Niveispirillum sp. TaxID=1917217 RepID=UPI001B3FBA18|nr:CDP-archaeol synthase [Niveispirillum sp.]MBP7337653.1 CDP-archaeol synthase [Niveispirillum sp.]